MFGTPTHVGSTAPAAPRASKRLGRMPCEVHWVPLAGVRGWPWARRRYLARPAPRGATRGTGAAANLVSSVKEQSHLRASADTHAIRQWRRAPHHPFPLPPASPGCERRRAALLNPPRVDGGAEVRPPVGVGDGGEGPTQAAPAN